MLTLADLAAGPDRTGNPIRPEDWNEAGVIHLPGLIPDAVIAAYCDRFVADAYDRAAAVRDVYYDPFIYEVAKGYGIGAPYLQVPEMRDVCLYQPLAAALEQTIGDRAGLHLNLSGWQSTTRQWHVDSYLSPPYVGSSYAAVWIALDDIDPDAGPFEYVPGSHLWPAPTQAATLAAMGDDGTDPDWPWRSEALLAPMYDREIINRGAHIERFIAKKGDCLIWHANLVHRGSVPNNPALERKALIAHYSGLSVRKDMEGTACRWQSDVADGWYFKLGPVT